MCSKSKTPKVEKPEIAPAPAAPPPPETVAEAPVVVAESKKEHTARAAKKRGTAALRIDLGTGGEKPKANGLSIPA